MTVSTKEAKTKHELEKLIEQEVGIGPLAMAIMKVPQLGWSATLITAPALASVTVQIFDAAVTRVRAKYDLKG